MLNRSALVLLAVCGAARAEPMITPVEAAADVRADLEAALRADPEDATAMLRYAALLRSSGRTDDALGWITAAYAVDPELVTGSMRGGGRGGGECVNTGPDVVVGDLSNVVFVAHEGAAQDGVSAYGIGTTSCNWGDEPVSWISNSTLHPVIAQNMYRWQDGVFTQVGIGWLKHGYSVISGALCCTCEDPMFEALGPGCSDPYSANLNASQGRLGPRYEVNATTGVFSFPYAQPALESSVDRRCQAADSDIDPARNPGARWFAEGHYITQDDAQAGNDDNNASWREMTFFPAGEGYNGVFVGPTVRGLPAIKAWPVVDPGAMVVDVDVPGDGRFHVGSSVRDNGDGTWRYAYAVHNMNSDRSAQAFSVPVPVGATLSNVGFHDVSYHSGEPFDGTDWAFTHSAGAATWTTEAFTANQNANAIRWGTAYSFWFTADMGPAETDAAITLFKPGTARGAVSAGVSAPGGGCAADLDTSGGVDAGDLAALLAGWGGSGVADLDGSGAVDAADLAILLAEWGAC